MILSVALHMCVCLFKGLLNGHSTGQNNQALSHFLQSFNIIFTVPHSPPTHRHLLALSIVLNVGMFVLWIDATFITLLAKASLSIQLTVRHPCLIQVTAHLKAAFFSLHEKDNG